MAVQLDAAFNYNDLQGLNELKKGVRDDSPEALKVVAQQFESMFISLIMKSMRDATDVMASDLENSYQTKFYRDMHDQQLSLSLSQNGGFGLADVLYEQLMEKNSPRPRPENLDIDVKSLDQSIRPIVDAMKYADITSVFESQEPKESKSAFSLNPQEFNPLLSGAKSPNANDVAQLNIQNLSPQLNDQLIQKLASIANKAHSVQAINSLEADANTVEVNSDLTLEALTSLSANYSNSQKDKPGKAAVFSSPIEFIKKLLPVAEQAAKALGVEPKVLLAQAALETGWGQFVIADDDKNSSLNFFGIKADSRWEGKSTQTTTHEFIEGKRLTIKAPFRAYDSIQESFEDYVQFVSESPRYDQAVSKADNAEQYLAELQNAGYATDPKYAEKIMRIAQSDWFDQV